jgi:hypothetical protein
VKKIKLNIEELAVSSFKVETAEAEARGTVRGVENSGWDELSCVPETCWGTSCAVRCESNEDTTPCVC